MKKSIFQENNLVEPEDIFNRLGNEQFSKEWNEYPLKILKGIIKKPKPITKKFLRNKFMADQVYKKLVKFLNEESVTIYFQKETNGEIKKWNGKRCSVDPQSFLLIDQEIHPKHGPMNIDYMSFWIEMPKEANPLLFKKVGKKPEHDKEYMKSIFPDVAKLIKGKASLRSLADAYDDFLKKKNIKAPSKNWIHENLDSELKKIKENQ